MFKIGDKVRRKKEFLNYGKWGEDLDVHTVSWVNETSLWVEGYNNSYNSNKFEAVPEPAGTIKAGDKVRRKKCYIDSDKYDWSKTYEVIEVLSSKCIYLNIAGKESFSFDLHKFEKVSEMFKIGDYVCPNGDKSKPAKVVGVDGDIICLHNLGWFNARDFTLYTHETINTVDKYETAEGYPVRVLATDYKLWSQYTLLVAVSPPNSDHEELKLLRDNGLDSNFDQYLFKVNPYKDFKIDDEVEVSVYGNSCVKRHFAGVSANGKPQTFKDGTSSFTTSTPPVSWEHCRKYEAAQTN